MVKRIGRIKGATTEPILTNDIFEEVNANEGRRLDLVCTINDGATARVYLCKYRMAGPSESGSAIPRAIKVFRTDNDDIFGAAEELYGREISNLLSVQHPNVVSLILTGVVQVDVPGKGVRRMPYYMMEYVGSFREGEMRGAKTLDVFLQELPLQPNPRLTIIDLLVQLARGVAAIHDNGLLHCDLKPGNVLIKVPDPNATDSLTGPILKIADLGNAIPMPNKPGHSLVVTTYDWMPEDLRTRHQPEFENARRLSQNAYIVRVDNEHLTCRWDLAYLGKIFEYVLEFAATLSKVHPAAGSRQLGLTSRDIAYLRGISARLKAIKPQPPRYESALELAVDLEKLIHHRSALDVPEITSRPDAALWRIPPSIQVPLSERVKAIVSHRLFRRLRNAGQLGLAYLVYPGATHTRFEHSLGCYYWATRFLDSLLSDPNSGQFTQVVQARDIERLLVAALIHDLAQTSFGHSVEEQSHSADHERIIEILLLGRKSTISDWRIPQRLYDDAVQEKTLGETIKDAWGFNDFDLRCVLALVGGRDAVEEVCKDSRCDEHTREVLHLLSSILSGPFDIDKVDYLVRDSHHTGLTVGGLIDQARLLASITTGADSNETGKLSGRLRLGVSWRGRPVVDGIAVARGMMYERVYWHRHVRSAHAMFGRAFDLTAAAKNKTSVDAFREATYYYSAPEAISRLASLQDLSSECREILRLLDSADSDCLYRSICTLSKGTDSDLFVDIERQFTEHASPGNEREYLKSLKDRISRELKLVRSLTQALKEEHGVDIRPPSSLSLSSAFIIDVPPHKRQSGSPYIIRAANGLARQDQSLIIKGVEEDWATWTRVIRVYAHPEIASKLSSIEGSEETILKALRNAGRSRGAPKAARAKS